MPIILAFLSGCSIRNFQDRLTYSGTLKVEEGFVDAVDGCILYPDGVLTPHGFFGRFGIGEGEFSSPKGIEVEGGRVYVLDEKKVMVFTLDGEFLREFGEKLEDPVSFSLDGMGRVYVLDRGLFSVVVFTTDGEYLYCFGSYGRGEPFLENPSFLCSWGNRVAVRDGERIKIFDYRGNFLYSFLLPAVSMDAGRFLFILLPDGLYRMDGKMKKILDGRWDKLRVGRDGIYLIRGGKIEVYTW